MVPYMIVAQAILKGTVTRELVAPLFLWINSIWAPDPDCEAELVIIFPSHILFLIFSKSNYIHKCLFILYASVRLFFLNEK